MSETIVRRRPNPYGRSRDRQRPVPVETYYGRPAVKPSVFEWKTGAYIFLAGMSGASQVIATLADLEGRPQNRPIVANGRALALPGILFGPVLLIWALHKPDRFPNMLRILRSSSPMSIGSWVLTSFSGLSVATAAADALGFRRVARVLGIPAAALGAVMATYTGALLASTSTPLWSAAPRLLAARFGAAGMASAAAALSLVERLRGRDPERLEDLAALAAAAELALGKASDATYRSKGVDAPLRQGGTGLAYKLLAETAGTMAPLALRVANALLRPRTGLLAWGQGLGILVGSLALRMVLIYGGNQSAERPLDYLRLTR